MRLLITALLPLIVGIEMAARFGAWVIPRTVHPPYLVDSAPASAEAYGGEAYRVRRVWRNNGLGARGDIYRGEPLRAAFFGTSAMACSFLSQEDSFPERFRVEIGGIHVDNYARDWAASVEAGLQLEQMQHRGERYDFVVIMSRPSQKEERRYRGLRDAFYHWGGYQGRGGTFVSLDRLVSDLGAPFGPWLRKWFPDDRDKGYVAGAPRDLGNRELRRSGKFLDYPENPELSADEVARARQEAEWLFAHAKQVAPTVIYITESVAYDERAVPGVSARWTLLDPVPGKPGYFLSDRSHAFIRRARSAVMAEVAQTSGVEVFDLDGALRAELRSRDDLFIDHNHFSPAGAAEAGRLLAGYFRSRGFAPSAQVISKHEAAP